MKTGKTLNELAAEITRQNESKRDFLADTRQVSMVHAHDGLKLAVGQEGFGVRDTAHSQIAERLKIPKAYYDRMAKEAPVLLATNVNNWLHNDPEVRMVRTLDGQVRAFMSDRYRTYDNYDALGNVLPVINGMNAQVMSCEVTERKMLLKLIFPEIKMLIPGSKRPNDWCYAGFCLSNSEVGFGTLAASRFYYYLACTNGMMGERVMKKHHLGRSLHDGSDLSEILRDETKQVADKAVWMMLEDTIRSFTNVDTFVQEIEAMGRTTQKKIEGDVQAAVEIVKKKGGLSDEQGAGILRHLIAGGDLSQWGLINAVTRHAEDQSDYEMATKLETLGGDIVVLSDGEWKDISQAKAA